MLDVDRRHLRTTLILGRSCLLSPVRLGAGIEASLVVFGTGTGCFVLHEYRIRRMQGLGPLFELKRMPHTAIPHALPLKVS